MKAKIWGIFGVVVLVAALLASLAGAVLAQDIVVWYLNDTTSAPGRVMDLEDADPTGSYVTIPDGGGVIWIENAAAAQQLKFPAAMWETDLFFKPNAPTTVNGMTVYIGTSNGTAGDFTSQASTVHTPDGDARQQPSISVSEFVLNTGDYIAFKLDNNTGTDINIDTGVPRQSRITGPPGEPILEPGKIKICKSIPCCCAPQETFTFQALQGGVVKGTATITGSGWAIIEGLEPGTYIVHEVLQDPSAYQQPDDQTVTVAAGETATVHFSNELYRPGKIRIIKYIPCFGPRETFTFQALQGGVVKGTATITGSGYAYISGLEPGTYIVREILKDGSAYQQPDDQTVAVEAGETATVRFSNKLSQDEQGKIKIIKEIPCCGPRETFTFEAEGEDGVVHTATITGSGQAYIKGLEPGTYTVHEILHDGSAYQQPDDQTVTVEAGETATVRFSNKLSQDEQGKIEIVKRWKSWNGPKETFTFQALQGGEVKGEATITGPSWWATATISGLEPGTYTVHEVLKAGSAYQQPDDQTVTVAAGETATVRFSNKLSQDEQGKIKIIKEIPCRAPGETFIFQALQGGVVKGTATITGSGQAYINGLEPGTYIVREILQDGSAYQAQPDKEVTVKAGKTATVYFSNKLKVDEQGKIEIVKYIPWHGPRETFTFQALQGGEVKGEVTITGPGRWGWATATISGLEPGTYTVHEKLQAGSAYQQPGDQTVTVSAGKTKRVYFSNKLGGGCCDR